MKTPLVFAALAAAVTAPSAHAEVIRDGWSQEAGTPRSDAVVKAMGLSCAKSSVEFRKLPDTTSITGHCDDEFVVVDLPTKGRPSVMHINTVSGQVVQVVSVPFGAVATRQNWDSTNGLNHNEKRAFRLFGGQSARITIKGVKTVLGL